MDLHRRPRLIIVRTRTAADAPDSGRVPGSIRARVAGRRPRADRRRAFSTCSRCSPKAGVRWRPATSPPATWAATTRASTCRPANRRRRLPPAASDADGGDRARGGPGDTLRRVHAGHVRPRVRARRAGARASPTNVTRPSRRKSRSARFAGAQRSTTPSRGPATGTSRPSTTIVLDILRTVGLPAAPPRSRAGLRRRRRRRHPCAPARPRRARRAP